MTDVGPRSRLDPAPRTAAEAFAALQRLAQASRRAGDRLRGARPGPSRGSSVAPAPITGYWRWSWVAAVFLLGLIVVRLPELFPLIGRLNLVLVSVPILAVAFLATTSKRALRSVSRAPLLRLTLCYAAWALLTAPFAMWPSATVFQAAYIFPIGLFLMSAILLCAPSRRNLDRVLAGFVGCTAILGAVLLAISVTGGDNRLGTRGMYDPNDLATLMAMTFPIAAHEAIVHRGRHRLLFGAAALVLATALVNTASRGGLVAMAVGIVVLLAALKFRRTIACLVAVVLAGAVLWSKGPPVFRERAASLLVVREDYNLTDPTGRLQLWKRGIGYAIERPITGLGMNNFVLAEGEFFRRSGVKEYWRPAHNTYIQVFAELGVIGGALLLAMLGVAIAQAIQLWRRDTAAFHRPEFLASLLAFCASAVFLSHPYAYLLFVILALVAFAARVARAEAAAARAATPASASGSR